MEGWMGVLPCLPGQVREEAAKVFLSGLSSLSFLTFLFDVVQKQPFLGQEPRPYKLVTAKRTG